MREDAQNSADEVISRIYSNYNTPPSLTILKAIAALEGVPLEELRHTLGMTLHEAIDPEALDALLTAESNPEVVFDMAEYHVRADSGMVRDQKSAETNI